MTRTQKIIKYCAIAFGLFLAVSIIGGIVSAVASLSSLFVGSSDLGEMKTYSVSENIEYLDIDISAASFEIKNGEAFSVESNHKYLSVEEENDTLIISEKKQIFGFNPGGVKIILTVPDGKIFEDVVMNTGAGRVDIESLSSDTLHLEFGAGAVEIDSLTAESNAEISGGAGKMTINGGELHNLDMEMGAGKLNLTSKITGKCKLACGVGSTKLVLKGSREDYKIELEKGLGSADIDGESISDDTVYGTGNNKISVTGGVGSVKITFEK